MGTITTGIGLISGIDTASLIDSLIALESQGKLDAPAAQGVSKAALAMTGKDAFRARIETR